MATSRTYSLLPRAQGAYVHAVRHHDTLYVSGLTAGGTAAQKEGLEAQTREVLRQLESILTSEHRRKMDIIKLTIFIRDISRLDEIRGLLTSFCAGHFPASSMVEVSGLINPDLLIQAEAIIALS